MQEDVVPIPDTAKRMGHVDIAGTSLLLVGTIGAGQGLVGRRGRVLVKREDGKDVDNVTWYVESQEVCYLAMSQKCNSPADEVSEVLSLRSYIILVPCFRHGLA